MTRHDSDSGPAAGFQIPKIFRVIIFMTECLAMPHTLMPRPEFNG